MQKATPKAPPVDLTKTRTEMDAVDLDEKGLDDRKYAIACDLWTANRVDKVSMREIARRVGRSESKVRRYIVVWDRREEFASEELTFSDAEYAIRYGSLDRTANRAKARRYQIDAFINRASVDDRAQFAADLLDNEEVARAVQQLLRARSLATPPADDDGEAPEFEDDETRRQYERLMKKKGRVKTAPANGREPEPEPQETPTLELLMDVLAAARRLSDRIDAGYLPGEKGVRLNARIAKKAQDFIDQMEAIKDKVQSKNDSTNAV